MARSHWSSARGLCSRPAAGPYDRPGDKKIYLDTAFFTAMGRDLGASSDFAAGRVVADQLAHHVQDELRVPGQANRLRARVGAAESNAISVRIELQAVCYAGVWARHLEERFGTIAPGDLEEAVHAAHPISDDTLPRSTGRVPMPHTFAHGTSAQRARWITKGYQAGDMCVCDRFCTDDL